MWYFVFVNFHDIEKASTWHAAPVTYWLIFELYINSSGSKVRVHKMKLSSKSTNEYNIRMLSREDQEEIVRPGLNDKYTGKSKYTVRNTLSHCGDIIRDAPSLPNAVT